MKNLKFYIFLFQFLFFSKLLLSQSGNVFPSTGFVGINTTSPVAELHVNGAIRGEGGGALKVQTDYGYIRIGPTNDGWAHILTDRSRFYLNKRLVVAGDRSISAYGDYPLTLKSNSGATELMRLLPNGNVGIGTSNPLESLHINGAIRGESTGALRIQTDYGYVKIGPNNDGWAHILTDRSKFYLNKRLVVGGDRSISAYGDYPLTLNSNSGTTEIMRLLPNGNVGIGTTTPQQKIVVDGGIQIGDTPTAIAGSIRFRNNEFEGYDGSKWVSLTTQPEDLPPGVWVPAVQQSGLSYYHNPCAASCQQAGSLIAAANKDGYVCKGSNNGLGTSVTVNGINPYRCSGGSANGFTLGQCYCLLPNSNNNSLNSGMDNTFSSIAKSEIKDLNKKENATTNFTFTDKTKANVVAQPSTPNNAINQLKEVIPNPFDDYIIIEFYANTQAGKVSIHLTNAIGETMESILIAERGKSSVRIDTNNLGIGTYFYSLIVDGEIIETKKMIKHK